MPGRKMCLLCDGFLKNEMWVEVLGFQENSLKGRVRAACILEKVEVLLRAMTQCRRLPKAWPC